MLKMLSFNALVFWSNTTYIIVRVRIFVVMYVMYLNYFLFETKPNSILDKLFKISNDILSFTASLRQIMVIIKKIFENTQSAHPNIYHYVFFVLQV